MSDEAGNQQDDGENTPGGSSDRRSSKLGAAKRRGEKPRRKSRARRVLKWVGITLALLVCAVVAFAVAMNQPRPETGVVGEPADELAHLVEAATGQSAWQELGAVEWNFGGRQEHLWDRARGYDRVRFGEHEVLLRIGEGSGVARRAGQRLGGSDAEEALQKAQSLFFNDSYWLNPFSKLFDEGVTRSLITTERGEALFVEFASGGSTPGDAYAIYLDDNGRPEHWEMWVSIIPIGGVGATWERWRDIGGGAMVAGAHKMGPVTLRLTGVRAAGTLTELGEDPFAELD